MATRIPVVVIDPGHGGSAAVGGSSANNATGPNGLLEKNLTLDIARRVASSLAGRARVILTRSDDSNLSLADRAAVARTNDALLFLSIHFNGWGDAGVDGTEVYVARGAGEASRGFARRVLSRLLAVTRVTDRGVKEADFGVLLPSRHARGTAACLAEVAFLTNAAQAARLAGEEYRRSIAEALTDAVTQYLPAEHFLHHDAARPDRRVPPPASFGLPAPHALEAHGDPWVPSSAALSASSCGCAGCAACAPPVARGLDADCQSNKAIAACEIVHDWAEMKGTKKPAHGTVMPNLFLRWNDIPAGTCEIDVVVHFHGDHWGKGDPAKMSVLDKIAVSGLDFVNPATNKLPAGWKEYQPTCAPRKLTHRKDRPTLCVLPLGRQRSGVSYQMPFFTAKTPVCGETGLQKLIRHSLGHLAAANSLRPGTFKPGRLILTAHSGGGATLSQVLAQVNVKKDPCHQVHEVHLFDAVYSREQPIIDWAKGRIAADSALKPSEMPTKGGALRVFYLPCSAGWKWRQVEENQGFCHNSQTETQSRNIHHFLQQRIPAGSFLHNWYRVEEAGVGHHAMPAAYGFQLLDNAGTTALSPKPSPPPTAKPACCASWDSTKWNNSCRPADCPGKPEQDEVKKAAGMSHVMSRI